MHFSTRVCCLFTCAALAPIAVAQTIDLVPPPYPPAYGGSFGAAVAGLRDVDGDGCGDVAVGAVFMFIGDPRRGRVFLFSGRTSALLRTIASPLLSGDGFGNVVGLNDIDGDGRADLAVAAHLEGGGGYTGRVHVFSGATGAHLYSLQSDRPTSQGSFALSLASAPDVDGDGVDDIVVGSENELPAGAAFVFSGAMGARLWSVRPQTAWQFSRAVAGVPDLDGDGRGDIAVSAPAERFDPESPLGVLYIFSGATGQPLHRLPFRCAALAGVPDLDGDGRGDLLAGWSVGNLNGEFDESGFVRVISGATGQLVRVLLSPRPEQAGQFGYSVTGAPDQDGDGMGEILVGAVYERLPNQPLGSGAAYLVSGASGALIRPFGSLHPRTNGVFGSSVAFVPHANGGDRPEVAVGAVGEPQIPGAQEGRAYLFLSCPADLNADGQATSQDFFDFLTAYFSQAPRADFNRDGALNSQDFFDFLAAFFNGCP